MFTFYGVKLLSNFAGIYTTSIVYERKMVTFNINSSRHWIYWFLL